MAYSPRKRAKRERPRIHSWQNFGDSKVLGFAGYKAGMTHLMVLDNRKKSPTSGLEISLPATVLDVPPMKVEGIRIYSKGYTGLESIADIKSDTKKKDPLKLIDELKEKGRIADVRLLMSTQPVKAAIPKKKPDVMEMALSGSVDEKIAYAKQSIGKEIKAGDVLKESQYVDVTAVTKGKGFQGVIKRWGVRRSVRKADGGRRHMGTGGTWTPSHKLRMEPLAGQVGYHTRTEYNKTVVKIGSDGAEVNPKGGFLRYGNLKSDYLIVSGSVPGPTKRIVRITMPRRPVRENAFEILSINTDSKQGL